MTDSNDDNEVIEPEVDLADEDAAGLAALQEDLAAEPIDLGPSEEAMMALRQAFNHLPALPDNAVNTDPLTIYLSRLRHLPLLEADKQQQLAVAFKEKGDIEAAKILILSNLRLVVKIAREYRRRWTNLLELIQEGNVGLSEAIRRYDPYRNVKFTSYAQYWIRAMILNYLMNHFQPVRIGSTRAGRKLFYNLKKARAQLVREGFLNPTPALIAEKLGVDETDVILVSQHLDVPPLSLEQRAPGFDETTVGELLPDPDGVSPETLVADHEFQTKVRSAMDEFAGQLEDKRDQALWAKRMTAEDPSTLSELGEQFGVSKERVRQLEVRLKKRFKVFITEQLGESLELYFAQD